MQLLTTLKRLSLLALIATLLCSFISTQSSPKQEIKGIVYDELKKPLPNVEVFNVTNGFVTVSDAKGHFNVKGKMGNVLRFIYPSKITKNVEALSSKNLKVYFDDAKKIAEEQRKKQDEYAKKNKRNKVAGYGKVNHKNMHTNSYRNAVTGQVTDGMDMLPLPGVHVSIKGTKVITETDIDGNYGIDAKKGDVVIFSFVGLESVEVKVNDPVINVTMNSAATLDEVVVVGYGSSVKIRGMASATTVSAESMEISPGARLSETVKKTVPGLAVTTESADYAVYKDSEGSTAVAGGLKIENAGQLTVGEVNDFSKWEYWEGLTKAELAQWSQLWVMSPTFRYSVVLTNTEGFPMVNKVVHLIDASKTKLWTSRTDNTGRTELWYKPADLSVKVAPANLQITDDKNSVIANAPKEFHEELNTYTYKEKCSSLQKVNIAFMVDATGSMGDEITYLQAELNDVISRTKKTFPDVALTMGSVFYRDFADEYLVKAFDFTDKVPNVLSFIQKQHANGGGDYPEAVIEAYEAAIENMSWDDDARAKLLFVVLDAPPHYSAKNVIRLQNLAKKASEKGIRIIPIAASGIDKSTEYLMRAMALQTNGTYLFITNHSGIGNDHIAPSTDSYKVEMLNDLILRVIVQFTAVNDCKDTELATNTRIEEQITTTNEVKWSYYPNPTSGIVTVDVDHEATALYLYDTTGKLVLYRDVKATQYRIDLSGLPNAVYYLKVDVAGKPLMGKIIKTM